MATGDRFHPLVRKFIEEEADRHLAPKQIKTLLDLDDGLAKKVDRTAIPDLRTVERFVKAYNPPDPSGEWSPRTGGAATLAVLAAVIEASHGRVVRITRAESSWIECLSVLAPEIPAWDLYRLARYYVRRESTGAGVGDLNGLLAFAPWGKTGPHAYWRAVVQGWVPEAPDSLDDLKRGELVQRTFDKVDGPSLPAGDDVSDAEQKLGAAMQKLRQATTSRKGQPTDDQETLEEVEDDFLEGFVPVRHGGQS